MIVDSYEMEHYICFKKKKKSEIISYTCVTAFPLSSDSADKVVTDRGKYEELIVCSHEIAASTAQLVAASKVK